MKTLIFALTLTLVPLTSVLASPSAFSVTVTGHGSPMILIPGLSAGPETWTGTIDHFKDRFECHVLTVAGFAGVPRTDVHTPMLDHIVDDLAAYIREHQLRAPVIVGHSLGGYLALKFASTYPDLTGPIVDVDGYPDYLGLTGAKSTPADVAAMRERIHQQMTGMTRDAYEAYVKKGIGMRLMVSRDSDFDMVVKWGLATDPAAAADAMAEMYGTDLRPALAQISVPTLVLGAWQSYAQHTDHDRHMVTLQSQFANVRDLRLELNDTARHFIMWDDPRWLFEQIDRFLVAR